MPLAENLSQQTALFDTTASLGFNLSGVLEEGRGEKPLTIRFQQMRDKVKALRLPFTLVGFGPMVVEHTFDWLYGHRVFRFSDIGLPEDAALLEITINGEKFGLEDHKRQWIELKDATELRMSIKQRCNDQGFIDHIQKSPARVRLPNTQSVRDAFVSVVLDRSRVFSNPALLLRLGAFANLLLIAVPWDYSPSSDDKRFLTHLTKRGEVFIPIAAPAYEDDAEDACAEDSGENGQSRIRTCPSWAVQARRLDASQAPAWLQNCGLTTMTQPPGKSYGDLRVVFPPVISIGEPPDMIKGILNGEEERSREALIVSHQTRNIGTTLDAVTERFNMELTYVGRKQSVLQKRSKELEEQSRPRDFRDTADSVQAELDEGISAMIEEITDRNRRQFAPEGDFMRRLSDTVLSLHDLDYGEPTPKAVRLVVPDDFVKHIKQMIKGAVQPQLSSDIHFVREEMKSLQHSLKKILSDSIEQRVNLEMPPPDEQAIWDAVNDHFSIDIRSRGEIPKAGILQALSGGRRWVYPVLIMVMLFSRSLGFGSGGMAALGPWILVLFIVGIVATYLGFKKERQETVAKELVNVREGMLNEAKKLLNEVQREKQARLTNYLNNVKKKTTRTTGQILRSCAEERALIARKAKQSVDDRLMRLKQQTGRLQEIRTQLESLGHSYDELARQKGKIIGAAIKTAPETDDGTEPKEEKALKPTPLKPNPIPPRVSGAGSAVKTDDQTQDAPKDTQPEETSKPKRVKTFAERMAERKARGES